jgi:hypothetical protein
MPNTDRFDDVRELLQKGKKDQARILLRMMGDDPRAEEWLERLNRVSPPKPDAVVRPALDEIDQIKATRQTQIKPQVNIWRRVWLGVRVVGVVLLLLQCVWVLPLLGRLGVIPVVVTQVEVPLPPLVEDALDTVADSPVGKAVTEFTDEIFVAPIQQANENMQDEVISRGFQQAAPMLDRLCEQQNLPASQEALCKDLMGDMQSCLAGGGSMDGCLDEVMVNVCREYFGANPAGYNTCIQQMNQLKTQMP